MTMTSTSTAASVPLSRDETGGLLGQTMGLVAVTAGFFALGAYIGRDTSGGWAIVFFIAAFAVLLGMNVAAQRSEQLAVGLLFGFGLLFGLASAPTVSAYVGADPQAVWEAGMASPVIEQLVAVGVFESLDAIVAERNVLLRARRSALMKALDQHAPAWKYSRPRGGLFLWVELPSPTATSLSVRARERGVHFTPGPRFGAAGLLDRYLRLPFTLPPDQLRRAVEVLASEAGEPVAARRTTVEPAYVV